MEQPGQVEERVVDDEPVPGEQLRAEPFPQYLVGDLPYVDQVGTLPIGERDQDQIVVEEVQPGCFDVEGDPLGVGKRISQ